MNKKILFLLSSLASSINAMEQQNSLTQKITTSNAPAPIGPFSQATLTNLNNAQLLLISGQVPFDIQRNEIISEIKAATAKVMSHLQAILNQAGMNFSNVIQTTIYLIDMKDFAAVNEVYGSYFNNIDIKPARVTVAVKELPRNSRVEISMMAIKSKRRDLIMSRL